MLSYLYSFFITLSISILGLYLFKKLSILDKPGNDIKNTRKPVPTLQGIFAYMSFWIIFLVVFPQYLSAPIFWGLAFGSIPIFLIELIEELSYIGKIKLKITPFIRLLVHISSAILALYVSGIGVGNHIILFGIDYIIPFWAFVLFFIIWAIFSINAINWIDGIYGQASGVSGIGFLTIYLLIQFVVMQHYNNFYNLDALIFIKDAALVMAIISIIYTIIEYRPLGLVRDVGTMFFGFSLAYLSIVGGAKIGTLVVALSLVIFDAIRVGLYRIFILKKNPMQGDYTHLHHRLLALGWGRSEIRSFVWIRSIVMMILMLLQGTNRLNKIIIFCMMAFIFFGVNIYLFIIKKLPCGLQKKK